MNFGPIKTEDDFKEIKKNNKGIILITDISTGDHIHTPSCSFVTEENYKEKVITNAKKNGNYFWYDNVSGAEKNCPTSITCTTCTPILEEQKNALNESGTFLQIAVFQKIINAKWGAEPEFPVSISPFVSDPMKQDIAIKRIKPHPEDEIKAYAKSSSFQQAVTDSQNESLRKETSIDVLSSAIKNEFTYILCTEVKKLNPNYVSWIFFQQNIDDNDFRVISKSIKNDGMFTLMKVLESDLVQDKQLFAQVEKFDKLKSFTPNCYDYGVTLTKDEKGNYKFQKSSLNEATTQVIEGTFGVIVDAFINQVTTGIGYDYQSQFFIPIVVTNANILTCSYDPKNLDLDSGMVTKLELCPQDAVIYEYPFPMRVRFPNQVTGVDDQTQLRHAMKWPVLILSPKGLDDFLNAFNNDVFK